MAQTTCGELLDFSDLLAFAARKRRARQAAKENIVIDDT
jgi:hypothetical protein